MEDMLSTRTRPSESGTKLKTMTQDSTAWAMATRPGPLPIVVCLVKQERKSMRKTKQTANVTRLCLLLAAPSPATADPAPGLPATAPAKALGGFLDLPTRRCRWHLRGQAPLIKRSKPGDQTWLCNLYFTAQVDAPGKGQSPTVRNGHRNCSCFAEMPMIKLAALISRASRQCKRPRLPMNS